MSGIDALPIVPASAMPAAVRDGTPEQQQSYRAALGFERVFVQQLTKELKTSGLADDESAGAQGAYANLVSDAFADGVVAAGGLGLAERLYQSMHPTNLAKTAEPRKAGS